MRFKVNPRDVPHEVAARRLGLSAIQFGERLPDLQARGFPYPDPTTGFFDLKAIEAWMDRRSGIGGQAIVGANRDPGATRARIDAMTGRDA